MESKIMLSVDLSYIKRMDQISIFDTELTNRKWVRMNIKLNIWKSRIPVDFIEEIVVSKVKEDLFSAANAAGISRIGAELYFNSGYSVTI